MGQDVKTHESHRYKWSQLCGNALLNHGFGGCFIWPGEGITISDEVIRTSHRDRSLEMTVFFVGKSSPRYAQQFRLVKYYHLPRYCNLEKKSSEEPANLGYLGGTRLWTHDHMWNVANEWYMMIYGHVEWCAPHECVCITILYVAGSCSILYVHIYIHAFFGKELAVVSQLLSGFLSSIYFMYSFS